MSAPMSVEGKPGPHKAPYRSTNGSSATATLCAAAGAAALALVPLASKPSPLLLWNPSGSATVGLYHVIADRPVRTGDMVAAFAPAGARALAAARGYLPASVPLVKSLAATRGDLVCTSGAILRVNGRMIAVRLRRDPHGRPLPWWRGCRQLRADELLLLGGSPYSFDGRYFGPVRTDALIGKAVLLWRA